MMFGSADSLKLLLQLELIRADCNADFNADLDGLK